MDHTRSGRPSALAILPDFELGELLLCPRFGTVDLGEVEPVRLEVDVHIPVLQNAKERRKMLSDLFLT